MKFKTIFISSFLLTFGSFSSLMGNLIDQEMNDVESIDRSQLNEANIEQDEQEGEEFKEIQNAQFDR